MTVEEQEQWEFVYHKMREEGFHYCFESYSNFEDIKNETFHKLRQEYLLSAKQLENYIKRKYLEASEIFDEEEDD
jgi:hypothetical protein